MSHLKMAALYCLLLISSLFELSFCFRTSHTQFSPLSANSTYPVDKPEYYLKNIALDRSRLQAIRRPCVGGNWKCNGTRDLTREIVEMLNQIDPSALQSVEVYVAPPSLHAAYVAAALRSPIHVAAQNASVNQDYGAYTGEISPAMLKDFGISATILGHSERRAGFGGQDGESDELVARKTKLALDNGLKVIACIGESLEERESGATMKRLSQQLEALKSVLSKAEWERIIIAYEPIWAIGTGKSATPQMAQDTHADIRNWILKNIDPQVADAVRIIYGGSVKGSNAGALISQPDIDGFLVGGASLTSDFNAIITSTAKEQ